MLRIVALMLLSVAVADGFQAPANKINIGFFDLRTSIVSNNGSSTTSTSLLESFGGKDGDPNKDNRGNRDNDILSTITKPFRDMGDMFASFDDVLDDFLYKRMGNGEVFYGKRKFKPSGRPNTEGKYNGMGLTDQVRIEVTREVKEERMERLRRERERQ